MERLKKLFSKRVMSKEDRFEAGDLINQELEKGASFAEIAREVKSSPSWISSLAKISAAFPERQRKYDFSYSIFLFLLRISSNPVEGIDHLASLHTEVTVRNIKELLQTQNTPAKIDISGKINTNQLRGMLSSLKGRVNADIQLYGRDNKAVLIRGDYDFRDLLHMLPEGKELEGEASFKSA